MPGTKTKMFLADTMSPATPPDGSSLEEKLNLFLATLTNSNILDVQVSLSKSGKYGENFMFAASVLYKVSILVVLCLGAALLA